MSHAKRCLLPAILIGLACLLRLGHPGRSFEGVAQLRGTEISKEEWNPLIAEEVNSKKITVSIDSKEYQSPDTPLFMDDNLNIMVPADILTEGLRCSSHIYGQKELRIEKRNQALCLTSGKPEISVNGRTYRMKSPMEKRNGRYFVAIGEVAAHLGYKYEWDIEKNRASAGDLSETVSVFPSSYDLREKKRIGEVKDQRDTGTCWAFASLSALESTLQPEESLQFSPDHMSRCSSFEVDVSKGGEFTMALAYLLAWQGPVYEKDDPFGDGKTNPALSAVKHVQEVQIMEGKDYEKIKEAVFLYGGVQTSLYSALGSSRERSEFYNTKESAYCYIGTERPNHEVVVIGWDDNYPKENFPVNVEGNGAFICQNSWGTEFGEDGVFYVSYYDTNIGSHNVVYTKVEPDSNYDNIYQSDLCGWAGQIGFGEPSVYGANVYTAKGAEELSAVGFYAVGKNTGYRIYLVREFKDTYDFGARELIAEGTLNHMGYYTVPLRQGGKEERLLSPGERYAVVIYLDTPDVVHPMAIEYAADEVTKNVDLTDGEGYISADGTGWERVEDAFSCNLCIKAYTKNR